MSGPDGTPYVTSLRRASALLGSFLLMVGMAVVLSIQRPAEAEAATMTGCDFADPGTGRFASTLCWIDFSDYDDQVAQSPTGQGYEVTIPGGYVLSFTAMNSYGGNPIGALESTTFPTYVDAFLGNDGFYSGVDGKPALNQTESGMDTFVGLLNIELRDPDGHPVHEFAIVGADAESTDTDESLQWRSQRAGSAIISLTQTGTGTGLGNACDGGFTGLGTQHVICTGEPLVPRQAPRSWQPMIRKAFRRSCAAAAVRGSPSGCCCPLFSSTNTLISGSMAIPSTCP